MREVLSDYFLSFYNCPKSVSFFIFSYGFCDIYSDFCFRHQFTFTIRSAFFLDSSYFRLRFFLGCDDGTVKYCVLSKNLFCLDISTVFTSVGLVTDLFFYKNNIVFVDTFLDGGSGFLCNQVNFVYVNNSMQLIDYPSFFGLLYRSRRVFSSLAFSSCREYIAFCFRDVISYFFLCKRNDSGVGYSFGNIFSTPSFPSVEMFDFITYRDRLFVLVLEEERNSFYFTKFSLWLIKGISLVFVFCEVLPYFISSFEVCDVNKFVFFSFSSPDKSSFGVWDLSYKFDFVQKSEMFTINM